MTTHTIFVSGTHCAACKHLIEDIVSEHDTVVSVTVSLKQETLTVETKTETEADSLIEALTPRLAEHGYSLHTTQPVRTRGTAHEWIAGGAIAVLGILGFILLERAGVASWIGTSEATLTTAFLVGLIASISTCLAVVGGLVLSVSATYAHEGKGLRPQALFHIGRISGFFILGGLLGALGEVVHMGIYASAALGLIASIVMVLLGIHLLDVVKGVHVFTLPRGISEGGMQLAHRAGMFAPVLLGAVTFFLPCGFTQSMQIVALASGDMVVGALTMLMFALGTLPILALLSFGSVDLAKSKYRGTFFKAAGMLVILFGLFNIHNALVMFGIITPLIGL